ncbi:sugar phosphate isomerase/epimerase family protein [Enterococcus sp. AZ109]|uniref:sugar phosphate isomerase/epimerase family protein n=1 Tax=Enterococcus sp. AZ109 TaxID=2774634 RepID=UPI003F22BA3D
MKNIPVSIQTSLDTSGNGHRWKQQLQQYRLLGYSLIELAFEEIKEITPEVLAGELKSNGLKISAIKVAEDFSIEEKTLKLITQFYQLLSRLRLNETKELQVIIGVNKTVEELREDLKAGYWHNLLKNLQLFSGFMRSVFSIETLIQPGREGLTVEKDTLFQMIQENHKLGLWLDTANVACHQLDPLKVLQDWRGMVRSLHLSDVKEETLFGGFSMTEIKTFLGEGAIDFGILYDELADHGFVQHVSVNPLLPSSDPDHWEECHDMLHILKEAGFN